MFSSIFVENIGPVLKKLGLHFYDEFKLVRYEETKEKKVLVDTYRFTTQNFEKKLEDTDESYVWVDAEEEFYQLLRGEYDIEICPFIPEYGTKYTYIDWGNITDVHGLDNVYITDDTWTGCLFDCMNLVFGNAFRTVQEAEDKKAEIVGRIMKSYRYKTEGKK